MTVFAKEASSYLNDIVRAYLIAKDVVLESGYEAEVAWQEFASTRAWSASEILAEYAWVVCLSGFRESTVRHLFPRVRDSFLDWDISAIVAEPDTCLAAAQCVFRHEGKMSAVLEFTGYLHSSGIGEISRCVAACDSQWLQRFPYLGPATSCHLLKNLGAGIAKPDRHLMRIAERFGEASVNAFCTMIASDVGDPVEVVDLVLWRFATLRKEYLYQLTEWASQ